MEECLEFAVKNHPSLFAANSRIGAAKADVAIAGSDRLPKASLSAKQNLSSKTWPGADKNSFSVTLEVTYAFFDGGVASAKMAATKKALTKAELDYRSVLDSIALNVSVNYEGARTASKRVTETAPMMDKAAEALEIALARYSEGVGSNLDVIDAQEALTQAKSNHTQALCDYNIYAVRLENAMGIHSKELP